MKKRLLKIAFIAFDTLLLFLLVKCTLDARRIKKESERREEEAAAFLSAGERDASAADGLNDRFLSEDEAAAGTEDEAAEAEPILKTASYSVSVWLQNVNGKGYKKEGEKRYEGIAESLTDVHGEARPGFTMLPFDQLVIKADGSTQVMLMYNRQQYTYSFDAANGSAPSVRTGRYGERVKIDQPRKKGYLFSAWNPAVPAHFGEVPYTAFAATYVLEGDYTISYSLDGGENDSANPASFNVESPTLLLAPASRSGYEFLGWFSDEAKTQPVTQIPHGSVGSRTLYAAWHARFYTVTLSVAAPGVKDAASFTPLTVAYDGCYGAMKQPQRTGYRFMGWNTQADGSGLSVQADTPVIIDADHTLYAQWQAKNYAVSFSANGGSGSLESLTQAYDSLLELPKNVFTREGYTFSGWAKEKNPGKNQIFDEGELLPVTKAFTVFAVWKQNSYSLHFNANGGQGSMASLSCTYDVKSALPACSFSRPGYHFIGWALDKQAAQALYGDRSGVKNITPDPDGSVTLYAVWWRPTVTFDAGNGDIAQSQASQQMIYDEKGRLKTAAELSLKRTGYSFSGWSTEKNAKSPRFSDGDEVAFTESTTLYAVWKANSYTLSFQAEGIAQSQKTVVFDSSYSTLPEPELHDYTFGGWFTAKNGGGLRITSSDIVKTPRNQTLYGLWHKNPIVTYSANGGSIGGNAHQMLLYDKPGRLVRAEELVLSHSPEDLPPRADFALIPCRMFSGWSTKADGSGAFYLNGDEVTFTKDVTLYAQWNTFVRSQTVRDKNAVVALTKPYYLCTHEVTQGEYELYCSYGGKEPNAIYGKGDSLPVYYVSWYDAIIYCNLRSLAEGLKPVYSVGFQTDPARWEGVIESDGKYRAQEQISPALDAIKADFTASGYRLPTEAEWQYAALGDYVGKGWTGYDEEAFSGMGWDEKGSVLSIDDYAWYGANSGGRAHPVKSRKPNCYGLYDMSGNVWEWCWDWFASYPAYFTKDPGLQDASSSTHVLRSGSWSGSSGGCSVSRRTNGSAPYRYYYYGFRLARSL